MTASAEVAMAAPEAATLPDTVRLHEEERILLVLWPSAFWTFPAFIFTLGLWYFWRKRHVYVLTNERVILVKGIVNTSEVATPLSRIQDIHVSRSILVGGTVTWSTAGGRLGVMGIQLITRGDARRLADAMTPYIGTQGT